MSLTSDYVELLLTCQVDELNCVTTYTDGEVLVLFLLWVLHRILELVDTEYVHIQVVRTLVEVTIQYTYQCLGTLLVVMSESDGVQVPHYNYVGDSILGYRSHMGAGSITSNVKSDKTLVEIRCGEDKVKTGLKKMGAVLGSFVEVGCGSILNPGTVIGSHTNVYPLSSVRGYVPGASIYKRQGEVVVKR